MTILKAQFIKGRPFSSDLAPKSGTVIARLFQIDSPNDEIRQIKSVKAPIAADGSVEISLAPTLSNQAYEITLAPRSKLIPPRFVQIPDDASINWEDLIDVNPNTFAPFASGGSGGGGGEGLKQYANAAELNAVKTPEVGVATIDDTLAAYPELADYVGNGYSKLVVTTSLNDHPMDFEDSPAVDSIRILVQTAVIPHPDAGNTSLTIHRKAFYDADTDTLMMPYESWTVSVNVRINSSPEFALGYFWPKAQGGGVGRMIVPATGSYTLMAVDGSLQWVEQPA